MAKNAHREAAPRDAGHPVTGAPAAAPARATAPVTSAPSSAEFNERQAKRRAEAAEQATARAEEEGRLPENSPGANPGPASKMAVPGGAFVEDAVIDAIPVDHPAIDNNPRAGTSAVQNGQDFNDPHRREPNDPDFAGEGLDLSVYGKAPPK